MLKSDAGCRNPPNPKIVHFPEEVILGQGKPLTSLISINCINNAAKVVHFDEADPLQRQIPYDGTLFYRSFVRSPTLTEIKKEVSCLTPYNWPRLIM